jgi:hypothetical protein
MRRWSLIAAMIVIATISLSASEPPVFIYVDDDAAPGGNGSALLPFNNLADAVAMARAVSGFVTVRVAPGDYLLTDTLVIDRSIDLRGSTDQIYDADGWPTGAVVPGTATRVFSPNGALTKLIAVDHGDGAVLRTVSIRGFLFDGTPSGTTMLLNRVQGYWIADNVFSGPAIYGLQSVASSGHASGNYFSGVGTGAIFAGGYPESPSEVLFDGNRAVNNSTGGVVLSGASINIPELGDELNAIVRDNDLSNNVGNQGFGLRALIVRRDANVLGSTQSSANVYAEITGNRLVGNRVGVFIDAGFPYRRVDGGCDSRVYSGTMNLRFVRNTLSGSSLTSSLITFTRNTAAINPALLPQAQYLHGASVMISDRDGSLADAWIDHPATDPVIGPCPGDATHEPLGNLLVYNGQVQPNGRNY